MPCCLVLGVCLPARLLRSLRGGSYALVSAFHEVEGRRTVCQQASHQVKDCAAGKCSCNEAGQPGLTRAQAEPCTRASQLCGCSLQGQNKASAPQSV